MPEGRRKFPEAVYDRFFAVLCRAAAQGVSFSARLMALNKADALLTDS